MKLALLEQAEERLEYAPNDNAKVKMLENENAQLTDLLMKMSNSLNSVILRHSIAPKQGMNRSFSRKQVKKIHGNANKAELIYKREFDSLNRQYMRLSSKDSSLMVSSVR